MTEVAPPSQAWGRVSPAGGTGAPLTYEQFALNLLSHAIGPERVAAVISAIAGDRVEVGPLAVGPGGAASAHGVATIGPVWVGRGAVRGIGFDARIPGQLALDLTVGSKQYRYGGDVEVPLSIAVELKSPAVVVLAVTPIRPSDVSVHLHTSGMAAFVMKTLGDADGEIAAQVTEIVNQKVDATEALRRIDIGSLLDQVWDSELRDRLTAHQSR